jgi:hypothetical protein
MWSLLLLLTGCKASISGAPEDPVLVDAATSEDAVDDPHIDGAVDAAMLGPWSLPAKLPQASTTAVEDDVTLSSNTLEMIFAIDGTSGKDLYYSSRPSVTGAWTTPVKLPFDSSTQSDETPRLSADDKTLFFASNRTGNGLDIYTVNRTTVGSNTTWDTPQLLSSVNTAVSEKWYMPCGTHYVMVQNTANNGSDLVEGIIGGAPTPIAALNSPQNETGTFLTQDCLTIFFASARSTPTQIYTSHRTSVTSPWQPPTPVVDFAIPGGNGNQEDPWMSGDGRTFLFASDASGNKDIYLSTR